jgi:radical SAM protein with 4Fe4S-binding SPASM domain
MSYLYVNLLYNVAFVRGALRSAIYDLNRKRIFSIDADGTELLGRALSEATFGEIVDERPDTRPFFESLVQQKLVELATERTEHNRHLEVPDASNPSIETAWVEMDTSCNHRCTHCYNESGPGRGVAGRLNSEALGRALDQMLGIGVQRIIFLGGEPLLYSSELKSLVSRAGELGFATIGVHTNGTLLSPEWLDFFRDHRVSVEVTVYGHRADEHDYVTQVSGSFMRTLAGLSLLEERHHPGGISLIVTPEIESEIPAIRTYFKHKYPSLSFGYDYLRPVGRGVTMYHRFKFTYLNRYQEHNTYFPGVSREEFLKRHSYNPCLVDKIAISPTGEIFPCTMTRISAGNVRSLDLSDIVASESFRRFRELSLEKVDVCMDCEYRYACTDCRPIALGLGRPMYSKPPECRYNPYLGCVEPLTTDT